MRSLVLALSIALLTAPAAWSETLRLDGDEFWVGLASGASKDEAIGLARTFTISPLMVVSSANGWYAAISGPYHVPLGTGRNFLDKLRKDKGASLDAYLTRGASYGGIVWRPPPDRVGATLEYDGEHDAELVRGDLRLVVSRQPDGKDAFDPVLTAFYKGAKAFHIAIGSESPNEKPAAVARLVKLDPASALPSIVFSYYWQGAHCCTLTKFATLKSDGSWAIVDSGAMDGDGYQFEDIDGSGRAYLVSVDQSFLYTFASYAGSFAPPKIQKLDGGQLVDVTQDASMTHYVAQELFRQKAFAKQQDELKTNGYLAAFVADSMMLGQGDTAWRTMLADYEHDDNGFGIDKCIDQPFEKCPDDKKGKLPFPAGLRQFLTEHGYMTDPDRFSVPTNATLPPPQPAAVPAAPPPQSEAAPDTPPQLQRCVHVADTVRKLIYQQFAGRQAIADETFGDVTLDDDETLEGYDSGIAKATCAVGYSFSPRALIGRLAEDGNMIRAASLGRLSRMRGGTITGRVRYTVKPTATAGTDYIELLP